MKHILMLTSDAHMSLYIWTQIEEIQYVSSIFLQIFQTDRRKNLFSTTYLKITKTHISYYIWVDSNSLKYYIIILF